MLLVLRVVGDLLRCEPEVLQKALTERTVATKHESFKTALSPSEVYYSEPSLPVEYKLLSDVAKIKLCYGIRLE